MGTDGKQFSTFFEKMMDGFAYHKIVLDEAGKPVDYVFLEVNDAFEKMTGLKRENILGRRATEVVKGIENDPANGMGVYGRVALTGEAVDFENFAEPLGKWYKISAYCPEKGSLVALLEDITERQHTEKQLADQAFMLANANDAIIAYDLDYRVTFWNKGAEKLYGYKEKEALGKVGNVLLDPTYVDINREELIKRVTSEGHIEAESIRSAKDGRRLTIEAHVILLRNEKGGPMGYVSIDRDITERRKASEALRESEEKYRSIVETAQEGIILANPDGRIVFANKRMAHVLGYSVEELTGKSGLDFVPERETVRAQERIRNRIEGIKEQYEVWMRRKDGSEVCMLVSGSPLYDAKGRHIGNLGMYTDITERMKAEEEIRSLARFPSENPNVVLRLSSEGKILYSNDAGSVMLNEWKARVGMAAPSSWRQLLADVSKSGGRKEFEEKYGTRTFLLMLSPIREAGYVNVYGRDITERKQVEQALRESQKDLTRAQAVAKTGSWRLNVQQNELLWSDETYRMFGIPKGTSMTYDSFIVAVHPDDRGYVDQKWQAALRGEPYDIEHRIVVNGEVRWVREKAELEVDERGSLMGGFGTVQDITERKDAEQRLLKEKQFSETLINSLPGVFYAIDADARFLLTNNEFARVTGYSLEEITKMKAMDFFGGEEKKVIEERIKQVFDKGVASAEAHLLSRIGDARLYYFTGARIERDRVPILIGMGMDITERKEMENALRETRDYLDSLLNYANAPMIVWNPEFKITKFNRAFEHLTGYKADEVLSRDLSLLFPQQSRERSLTEIQHTSAGEHWEVVEIPILRKDGDVRTVLWNSANIYADDGKTLTATIAQGQDITERKEFEDALRETRDYLESLLNYANAPIIVWDPASKITRFNRAFEHLAGYKAEEVVGRDLSMLFPAESTEESLTEIQHTSAGEHWEVVEIPILRKDGDIRTVLWNSANIYTKDGKALMATIAQGMDITERKKLEEKLKRSERMAAIGETAAMVGHDLRNPLQAIVGFIALTEEQLRTVKSPSAKKQKMIEPLKAINQQVQYMNKIVLDLQDYARPLEPELKETQLLDLVKQVFSSMQIPPTVTTSVQIPDNFPKISVDPTLITRAQTNLLRNAPDAMPEGEKQTVKASQGRGEASIGIMDTGIGIPKENIPKLFTPLFTTKAKGQGFGLPVCKQIIEAHGGSIKVKSQLGKGSTFTLKIPFGKRKHKKNTQ